MYKKDILKTIGMIVIVLLIARIYNSYQNDNKVEFFMKADKVIVYNISYEDAIKLEDNELKKHIKFTIEDVDKVVKSASYEKESIETHENNYGTILYKDKVYKAKFINYALAFVIDDEKGFYRYKLFDSSLDSIIEYK